MQRRIGDGSDRYRGEEREIREEGSPADAGTAFERVQQAEMIPLLTGQCSSPDEER